MKITADLIPDVVEFSIPKFSEYNPRRDVQRSSWFRLESSWYLEVTKKGVSWAVASLWPVFIGALAGTKSKSAKIDIKWLARTLKTKTPLIKKALCDLHNHEMLVVENLLTLRDVAIRTNERTNETYETNGCQADEPVPDKTPPKAKNTPPLPAPPKATPPKGRGSPVWDAYAEAYRDRYRTEPKRNQKANAICAQLVDRLGVDDAIAVVRFYLSHNKAWYVQRVHPLDACLADCEGLHTQRLHNFRVTTANARQEEVRQSNLQTFQAVAERLAEKHLGRKDQHDEH